MQKRCEMRARLDIRSVVREWRKKGKHACRHGVFFDLPLVVHCPCLQPRSEADWNHAVLMPALHEDLKCIVTDTFNASEYRRLGILQAEARRLCW